MDFPINENTVRPPYPPIITPQELLKYKSIPNSFILYRMELRKNLKTNNITINRKDVSGYASRLWKSEHGYVKDAYKKIERDATILLSKTQQEVASAVSAISGENLFTPSPALLQEGHPSYSKLEQLNLTPILNFSDLVPGTSIEQCTQILFEQQPSFNQVPNNNGNLIESNYFASSPYLQENSFAHGNLNIEQEKRIQNLEQNISTLYYNYGYIIDTGSGSGTDIERRIQTLEALCQTFISVDTAILTGQGTIELDNFYEIFSARLLHLQENFFTLNIEQHIQLLEQQIIDLFLNKFM